VCIDSNLLSKLNSCYKKNPENLFPGIWNHFSDSGKIVKRQAEQAIGFDPIKKV
jgi:hypothetical protein